MASMRDIKRRKSSISSTQQITKAMKLVSTVKLQKAKTRAEQTDPYFRYMYKTVSSILAKSGNIIHPYLTPGDSDRKAVVVLTSNRGLAGGYNTNVVKLITNGDFNNSFHHTRSGIAPDSLSEIIKDWSKKIQNTEFLTGDYSITTQNAKSGDLVYLDPPYANTKGMYYGTIDYAKLWDWLRNLPCKYALSFDGISGEEDNTWNVPTDVYSKHEYLLSGNSSFKRTIGKSNDSVVYESLYLK